MEWILVLMFLAVLPTFVVSMDDIRHWECETKSVHWNAETHQILTSRCGDLKMSFDKQHCALSNTTLIHCMVERARMHDNQSCMCHRGDVYLHLCNYIEVCAFVDPNFQCSNDYTCKDDGEGQITCVSEGHASYTTNCTRGMIYCPDRFCILDPRTFYEEECRSTYQEIFGEEQIVYYIERLHFSGSDYEYSTVNTFLPQGLEDPCLQSSKLMCMAAVFVNSSAPSSNASLILMVTVSLSVILVLLLAVYVWRVRRRLVKQDERWKNVWTNTWDFVTNLVQNGENSLETADATEIAERVDPIVVGFPAHADEDVQEFFLDKEMNCCDQISQNNTTATDCTSTRTSNIHCSSNFDSDNEDDLIDERPADVLCPVVFDSGEKSVFEAISDNHIPPDGFNEASTTKDHSPRNNVYENTTYGQMSFSSGYIPKSLDFD